MLTAGVDDGRLENMIDVLLPRDPVVICPQSQAYRNVRIRSRSTWPWTRASMETDVFNTLDEHIRKFGREREAWSTTAPGAQCQPPEAALLIMDSAEAAQHMFIALKGRYPWLNEETIMLDHGTLSPEHTARVASCYAAHEVAVLVTTIRAVVGLDNAAQVLAVSFGAPSDPSGLSQLVSACAYHAHSI